MHSSYVVTDPKGLVLLRQNKQEYLGYTILGKTICGNFKTKKRRKAKSKELMVFPDIHEPIITQEMWDQAQKMRKRAPRRRAAYGAYSHRLSGLLFCADCGARLSYRSPEAQHRADGKVYDSDNCFVCSNYRNKYHGCTSHFIKVSILETALLKAVQSVSNFLLEDAFLKQLQEQWNLQQQVNGSDRKELTRIKRRIDDKEIFDTPKPEQLLYRIIQIATNEEDLLLDCFLGSGTTMAVAHKMKRNYISCKWK